MERRGVGVGFLVLGALVLAACAGPGEKTGSGVSEAVRLQAPAAQEPAAPKPAVEPAVAEKPVPAPQQEEVKGVLGAAAGVAGAKGAAEGGGEAARKQVAEAPGEVLQEAGGAAGAGTTAAAAAGGTAQAAKEGAAAPAKPGESVVRFDNEKLKEQGPVEFSHPKHKQAFGKDPLDCKPCHMQAPPLFLIKKRMPGEARYTMEEMNQGKACGKCHDGETSFNGKTAFAVSKVENCGNCHQK